MTTAGLHGLAAALFSQQGNVKCHSLHGVTTQTDVAKLLTYEQSICARGQGSYRAYCAGSASLGVLAEETSWIRTEGAAIGHDLSITFVQRAAII